MNTKKQISHLSVRRDTAQGKQSIRLIGPFDCLSDIVLEYTRQIIEEGNREIVLDLHEVTHMTSQGIACIIKMLKLTQSGSCSLAVSGAGKDMIEMIRFARIEHHLTFIG